MCSLDIHISINNFAYAAGKFMPHTGQRDVTTFRFTATYVTLNCDLTCKVARYFYQVQCILFYEFRFYLSEEKQHLKTKFS